MVQKNVAGSNAKEFQPVKLGQFEQLVQKAHGHRLLKRKTNEALFGENMYSGEGWRGNVKWELNHQEMISS